MALVKICGLTRIADAGLSLRLGADYCGAIVQIARSPRCLSFAEATQLLRACRGKGVMVTDSHDAARLADFAAACDLGAIQLHGDQPPGFTGALRGALGDAPTEIWPVLAMSADETQARQEVDELAALASACAGNGAAKIVLDSKVKGQSGGTGVPVNWELARRVIRGCPVPVLLAGGITPENAAQALTVTGAAGVDVSSGVEAAPRIKNPRAVAGLIENVRACCGEGPR